MAHAMRLAAGLPPSLCLPGNITPHEKANHEKPDIGWLRPWGAKVWIKKNKDQLMGKFNSRAKEGHFVGIGEESKGIRVWYPGTHRIVIEHDFRWSAVETEPVVHLEGERDTTGNLQQPTLPANTPGEPPADQQPPTLQLNMPGAAKAADVTPPGATKATREDV
ncbi:hypothetical protein FISHEDRAFT_68876 [Fistulina hepatica ATCC 64428]|uniref:Retroviral polymerase SH3-like domain-containing protein n=1 Tax=Fistulina hepatica ATCC 64428 TaxID=1128425 RepID=A0A0D7ARS8_9AGAR|nr:hypothetical protein FISHEDRAFT_68876 [Fistulina hepatica ATCC 64428]